MLLIYLHPVELLDGVEVGLAVLGLEGLPFGLLHEGGGRPDQEHNQQDLHDTEESAHRKGTLGIGGNNHITVQL